MSAHMVTVLHRLHGSGFGVVAAIVVHVHAGHRAVMLMLLGGLSV
jgi:hypothetical protein